jgi:hypothetical protein
MRVILTFYKTCVNRLDQYENVLYRNVILEKLSLRSRRSPKGEGGTKENCPEWRCVKEKLP